MSKVEMTPEEMEAREQEEFNTGPLRVLTDSVKNNTQVRVHVVVNTSRKVVIKTVGSQFILTSLKIWWYIPRERFLDSPPLLSILYICVINHVAAAPGPLACPSRGAYPPRLS